MLKIIFLFLQLKISFSYPKKNKILVIDKIYSDLFKKLISKNLEVISVRYENLNFFVLLNLLFSKRKKNFFNYILIYIELINPSLIITGNDNLIWFYKLKKNYPNKKFISVQNGFRNKLFFNNLRKERNLSSDYIFTFNSSFANLYKKYIRTKTKVIGSLKNNSIKIKQKSSRKVLFVSSGFPRLKEDFNLYKKVRFKKEDYFNQDKILIRNLIKFCAKENLKLFFLPKNTNYDGNKEIKYYKENIDSNLVNFITKKSQNVIQGSKKIYSLADKSLITVSTASSFGLENLARGNRSVIFNNKIYITKNVIDLFWNYKFKQKGPFWSNENSFSEVNRLLDFNLKKNKNLLNVKRITKILMSYDNRNNTFRKIIKNLI